jgi:galactoside O-acetyltransferase
MAFLNSSQLSALGLRSCGENVLISNKASIYRASQISLGNHVRIDDFCILSGGDGGIWIGDHVHIACYSSLIGKGAIKLENFSNISARVSIYSSSDDYSGAHMTNPTIPAEFTNVDHRPVIIGRHAIVGCGSVVLPGVKIGDGCAVGALSLVKDDCQPFTMYAGIPAHVVGKRDCGLVTLERRFLEMYKRG